MGHSMNLHDVENIQIEENQHDAKHSEGCKHITFETGKGEDVTIKAFGDFETEYVGGDDE